MDSTLTSHVIERVEERAHVLQEHERFLIFLWDRGRNMTSADFFRYGVTRRAGCRYRMAFWDRRLWVLVRGYDKFVTLIRLKQC